MPKLRILVCDDRPDVGIQDVLARACPHAELVGFQGNRLTDVLKDFFTRVDAFLKSDNRDENDLPQSEFDDFDIVFVDNNLAELEIPGARLTAESILGALRAFTTSRYLVSLNKNPLVDFDLRYLVGDYSTRADLALNEQHLENGVLWNANVEPGKFAPWYWPSLIDAASRRSEQVSFVEKNLDVGILAALGIPHEVWVQFPSRAVGFLDPEAATDDAGRSLANTTFWHHYRSSNRSVPFDDRVMATLGGSKAIDDLRRDFLNLDHAVGGSAGRRIAARVIAAEIDSWIRRDLLGPQDLLVDPPHLQVLIGARTDGANEDAWQQTATEQAEPFGFDPELYRQIIGPRRFEPTFWTPRPAFWWPLIEEDPALMEFRKTAATNTTLAFAEDTRRFVKTTGDAPPWRFVSETGKPWSPLFVERVKDHEYSPKSSFAR